MKLYLGIDTSCYTTSVCLLREDGSVAADERIILTVPAGSRGLSQSNMIYQHTRNLPLLLERLCPVLAGNQLQAVAVTDKPRRREDSYMPAFLAGLGCARSLAAVLAIPLYRISHQENHLLAVLRTLKDIPQTPFFGLHLSGGTTDFLYVVPDDQGLAITRIGGSSDISAGQFIDRVGVALGLSFPAGVQMEQLARQGQESLQGSSVFCKDGEISYSGPESQAQRLIASGEADAIMLSRWTLATIWNGLYKLLEFGRTQGMRCLAAAGGVMSNAWLRQQLEKYCRDKEIELHLPVAGYSADNASGAAFWAMNQERGKG